jgi:hypothetical protein
MYDEHDKQYDDQWTAMCSRLKQLGGKRKQLKDSAVEEAEKSYVELETEYTKILSDLEQLWKRYNTKLDPG